ncbi:hypothetical protein C0991_008021 [Blastosporella zonata]|nr:hypothetical protein C0991_008021 [Blastosporella zonata]
MSSNTIAAAKTAVTTQPKAETMKMQTMTPENVEAQEACTHKRGLAQRLRGGGAAKDCFLGLIGCFLCCGMSASCLSSHFKSHLPIFRML